MLDVVITGGKVIDGTGRAAVAAEGRDPDSVKILPACYAIPAESADMAAEKKAVIVVVPIIPIKCQDFRINL